MRFLWDLFGEWIVGGDFGEGFVVLEFYFAGASFSVFFDEELAEAGEVFSR